MNVTITIRTDNAAFEGRTRAEIADILRKIAKSLDYGDGDILNEDTRLPAVDCNGNTVGFLTVKE